jgi:hypothetical protein
VFRRRAHLAVPYDPRLRISADYGAIAALLARGAIAARLDHPIAIRHCDPASLSERHTLQRLGDFVRVQRRVLGRAWPQVAVSLGRQILVDLAYRLVRDARQIRRDRLGQFKSKVLQAQLDAPLHVGDNAGRDHEET